MKMQKCIKELAENRGDRISVVSADSAKILLEQETRNF